MLKVTKAVLLMIAVSALWFVYVQGVALIPNYRDHPFHQVAVDFRSDDEVKGWPIFDDNENVSRLTRLGYAFALAKFPDAQSCLENPSEPLNVGSSLRWSSIKRPKQAAVCFFNIAHAFADRYLVREWLSNMPENAKHFYGIEGMLGRPPRNFLFLSLKPLFKEHCLANFYRCTFISPHQSVPIEMSAEGEVLLIYFNRPKLNFN